MRMIEKLASPGMEHAHQAGAGADEPGVLGQLLQGCGRSAKEQVVDGLLVAASDRPQLLRQSESHQEVMNGQEQALLLC
ncbi:MAG: hypothetical protein ABR568_21815 [Pyrinomonadaceae bacterium]